MTLNRKNNQSWKALSRKGYARTLAATKVWVSTTGPSELVGTRYYEVLASGTTLLLCNAPASPSVYDGLFEDGVHVVTFRDTPELREKVLFYLAHEGARRKIVQAAHALASSLHTWVRVRDSSARWRSAPSTSGMLASCPTTRPRQRRASSRQARGTSAATTCRAAAPASS